MGEQALSGLKVVDMGSSFPRRCARRCWQTWALKSSRLSSPVSGTRRAGTGLSSMTIPTRSEADCFSI